MCNLRMPQLPITRTRGGITISRSDVHPLNASIPISSRITLTRGGDDDFPQRRAFLKYTPRNILQGLPKTHGPLAEYNVGIPIPPSPGREVVWRFHVTTCIRRMPTSSSSQDPRQEQKSSAVCIPKNISTPISLKAPPIITFVNRVQPHNALP